MHTGGDAIDPRADAELVAACRRGDASAWEELLRRYQRLIYTVPMRFGLSEDAAADVFQQTCLRLFERLDTLENPDRVSAWLVSTSRRLSLDALSRRGTRAAGDDLALEHKAGDDAPLDERLLLLEQQQRIRAAVDRLDQRCRAIIHHLFYDVSEPSYQQIAGSMSLPLGSIGPIRARCFARLKTLLADD